MNSTRWSSCSDLGVMLDVLGRNPSARKLNLFACACCRNIKTSLSDSRSKLAVEASEAYAEGLLDREAAAAACDAAYEARKDLMMAYEAKEVELNSYLEADPERVKEIHDTMRAAMRVQSSDEAIHVAEISERFVGGMGTLKEIDAAWGSAYSSQFHHSAGREVFALATSRMRPIDVLSLFVAMPVTRADDSVSREDQDARQKPMYAWLERQPESIRCAWAAKQLAEINVRAAIVVERTAGLFKYGDKIINHIKDIAKLAALVRWDAMAEERDYQCNLLREVFGNPFNAAGVTRDQLLWKDGHILKKAQEIYASQQWNDLCPLGDALVDAGVNHTDSLVIHCRSKSHHVRGCWALDLLLQEGRKVASGG